LPELLLFRLTDPPPPEISALSLHDALPICKTTLISIVCGLVNPSGGQVLVGGHDVVRDFRQTRAMIGLVPQELTTDQFETVWNRSEEHTSELQSRENLVCRLLLEKKKRPEH